VLRQKNPSGKERALFKVWKGRYSCNGLLGGVTKRTLHIGSYNAGLGNGGAELLRGAVESLGSVADFLDFVDVDPGAVSGAAVLKIVGRSEEGFVE
jgi:hypothetical protein